MILLNISLPNNNSFIRLSRLSAIAIYFFFLCISGFSQIPPGYYDAAIGKSGVELQLALYNIIKTNHSPVSYTPGVWKAFYKTDKKANGKVWDMYSDIPSGTPPYEYDLGADQCGTSTKEGDCYSREHSFPQSYFGGDSPMYTDLNHIFPVDQYVNGTGHSNHPYGTVATPAYTSQNGSKRGPCSWPGYTGTVFEPLDAYKGDFARAYFYMATRYQDLIGSWAANSTEADAILDGTSYPAFETWFTSLLLAWHASDPVSAKEIARNDSLYFIQHNRNPYIDHPEYVLAVWQPGGIKDEPSNHPTDFHAAAGNTSYNTIDLGWTDAAGSILPDGYLIKGSTSGFAAITDPADGTAVADGGLNKNIPFGSQAYTFSGLSASTTYYFKIYSYTNSGSDINYKTNGVIPTASLATTAGASTLQAGDIAITEVGATDPDKFSFITLKQLSPNTVINFTDNGFSNATICRTGEGVISYTAPTTIPAGTVISWISGSTSGDWSVVSGFFQFSVSGDQLFAFQGTWNSDQILLFGINFGNTSWLTTGAATSNTSYLPSVLTDNVNALNITGQNCNYNLISRGSINSLGSLIANPANWTTSSSILTTPSWNFTLDNATTISQNATVYNLTISSGETLTIPAGKQLTVNGNLSNSAGNGGLVMASDATGSGSLIHHSDYVPATVNRYFRGTSYAWHLLSSPVSMVIAGSAWVPGSSNYDFYCWDETGSLWVNFKNTSVEPTFITANGHEFIPGKGYLVAYEATAQTKPFTGLLNNGTIDFDLSYSGSGAFQGYNLTGNPYPSAIDWKASPGWTRTSLATSGGGNEMWIWNQTSGNYGAFNSASSSDVGTNDVTRYIPSGQGFFVLANAQGFLSMNNLVRVHQHPAYLKSAETLSNVLRLKVTSPINPFSDEVVVEFEHETAQGGTHKLFSMQSEAPELYLLKDHEKYSIDFRGTPSPQQVALCFLPGIGENHTLTAELTNTFHEGTVIDLEDLKTGYRQDLVKNPVYAFQANTGDDPGRFMLHFGGTIGIPSPSDDKNLLIYTEGKQLFVQTAESMPIKGSLSVYTLLGQQILHQPLSGSHLTKIELNTRPGYYLVRVITPENTCSEKVMIR